MAARKHSSPAPPIDSPDRRRLPPLLRRAWYGLNQAFRRRIARTGATPDQFTAMRCLTEADPLGITQGELAQLMSSDPNTIASLVERMETAGWVERRAHEKTAGPTASKSNPPGSASICSSASWRLNCKRPSSTSCQSPPGRIF